MLDQDIQDCRALIIDANPTSRSILAAQLRDFGLGTVVQTSRIADARRQLEVREFDVVLCDFHFDGHQTGQELIDDLRRANVLPFSTVFIMVTGEAAYDKVAEAAESALDGYLLKPHNAAALAERLMHARRRKRELRPIFTAIEAEDFQQAARLCMERFRSRGRYWLYAARIGAELLLRLGDHDAARQLYEAITKANALPWARLGIARAELDGQRHTQARRTLESLLSADPSYADAYDVMGRLHIEQGSFQEALATYRQAAALTPASVTRLQKQGMLAFYIGEFEEAARQLQRAVSVGISSKMFDYQSLVLLAITRFKQGEQKGLQRCRDELEHALQKAPGSDRLRRFLLISDILLLLLARQLAQTVEAVKQLCSNLRDHRVDFEAACNVLTVLATLRSSEVQMSDDERWIETLAMRFATSKACSEVMTRAAGGHAPYQDMIRGVQAKVVALAEEAVAHSLAGDHAAAVDALLMHGTETLNPKLIDMAHMALQRHQEKIPQAAEMRARIDDLRKRYCGQSYQVHLGRNSGRQAGELALRAAKTKVAAETPLPPGAAHDEATAATPENEVAEFQPTET
ncbi:MAG TPA: response regulator [Burkholderiaceae bacterium]|nr:response regulator [Burkholderiaceae bacterium]